MFCKIFKKNLWSFFNCLFFLIAVFSFIWMLPVFTTETFDLDESLYRHVSSTMKQDGELFIPKWDGKPFYHKPPLLYWYQIAVSYLIDGFQSDVSFHSVRLSSFVLYLIMILLLFLYWKRHLKFDHQKTIFSYYFQLSIPVFLFFSIWYVGLTSTAGLFEPLLSLALLPVALVYFDFFSGKKLNFLLGIIVVSFGIGLALSVKGLVGLLIPVAAVGVHFLITSFLTKFKFWTDGQFKPFLILSVFGFLGSLFFSFIYYSFIYFNNGGDFLNEFFWLHHVHRALNSMEAHGGPWYYYLLIVLFGGGAFTSLFFVFNLRLSSRDYVKYGFGFSWFIATLFFFSLSETKLSHYILPAWPPAVLSLSIFLRDKNLWAKKDWINFVALCSSSCFFMFNLYAYVILC